MPRLFDHVAYAGLFKNCTWILADDVVDLCDSWHEQLGNTAGMTMQGACELLPSIRPAQDNMFVEFREKLKNPDGVLYVGATVKSWFDAERDTGIARLIYLYRSEAEDIHILRATTIIAYNGHGKIRSMVHSAMAEHETAQIYRALYAPPHVEHMPEREFKVVPMRSLESQEEEEYANMMALTFLFFLSMMNTKNVEIKDVEPPRKANQRHIEKHGKPMLSYKVLRVHPATVVHYKTRQDAPTGSTPIPRPLHTVRGHFKDYRDGKGLFGRFKDIFWFPEQLRGSPENGIAVKDYQLVPDPKKRKD